jgi:hypothetical protein
MMNKHDALRVSKETIETTYALLNQLEELSKEEATHFYLNIRAIIKTVQGILYYENSNWKIDERYKGLTTVIEGLLQLLPLDYSVNRQAVVAKYLNAAIQFDPKVRGMVAKHYRLKKMKDRMVPTWYYD